jgi:hypothetical protein
LHKDDVACANFNCPSNHGRGRGDKHKGKKGEPAQQAKMTVWNGGNSRSSPSQPAAYDLESFAEDVFDRIDRVNISVKRIDAKVEKQAKKRSGNKVSAKERHQRYDSSDEDSDDSA